MFWIRTPIIPLALILWLEDSHNCFRHQGSSLHVVKFKSTKSVITVIMVVQWPEHGQIILCIFPWLSYQGRKIFPRPLHWVWVWSHLWALGYKLTAKSVTNKGSIIIMFNLDQLFITIQGYWVDNKLQIVSAEFSISSSWESWLHNGVCVCVYVCICEILLSQTPTH